MLILIVVFFVFSDTLQYDFIFNWDDNVNVTENLYIRDLSLHGIKTLFSQTTPIIEPRLTLFSYALQYHFSALHPVGYHFVNILLHLLNVLLVYFFVTKLLKDKWVAIFCAILFGLHPMRVESVAWVTGRKDLLFTAFYLLSMIFYISYIQVRKIYLFFLVLVFAYLSYLSKIQAVTLPLALFLIDYFYKRKPNALMFLEKLFLALVLLNLLSLQQAGAFCLLIILWFLFIKKYEISRLNNDDIKSVKGLIFVFFNLIAGFILLKFSAIIGLILFLFLIWLIFEKTILVEQIKQRFFNLRTRYFFKILVVVIIGIIGLVAVFVLSQRLQYWNTQSSENYNIWQRFIMGNYALGMYLYKFLIPVNLSAIYPYPNILKENFPVIYFIFLFVTPAIIVFIIYVLKGILIEKRILNFGILFFTINIFLFLHVIPIQGRLVAADRYTYLAYLGLIIFVVCVFKHIIDSFPKYRKIVLTFSILACVCFSILSYARCKVWKNEIEMFSDVIEKQPQWATAYSNRGTLYAKNNRSDLAILDYNKAIEVDSTFSLAYYNRALYFVNKKEYIDAISDCEKAYKYSPTFFDSYYLSGYSKNIVGDFYGALRDLNRAIALDSSSYLSFFNRGVAWKGLDSLKNAINDYSKAIKIKFDFAEAYNNRGIAKYFQKDYEGSIIDYNQAIKINNSRNAYFNKGLSEIELKQLPEACDDFKAAQSLGYTKADEYLDKYCK